MPDDVFTHSASGARSQSGLAGRGSCSVEIDLNSSPEWGGDPLKYEQTFSGPLKSGRRKTDAIATLGLAVIICTLLIGAGISLIWGRTAWLKHESNSQGTLCGYGSASMLPYLWWPIPTDLQSIACVGSCPIQGVEICWSNTTGLQAWTTEGSCKINTDEHLLLFGRCIPKTEAQTAVKQHAETFMVLMRAVASDAWKGWWAILAACLIITAAGHVLMLLMQYSILAFALIVIVGNVACLLLMGIWLIILGGSKYAIGSGCIYYSGASGLNNAIWLSKVAYAIGLICFLYPAYICFHVAGRVSLPRLKLISGLLETAVTSFAEIRLICQAPLVVAAVLLCCCAVGFAGGFHMVSLLIQINLNKSPLPNEVMEQAMRFALWGMIPAWPLVLLWLTSVIITVMRLHIAYAVSTWYWTREPRLSNIDVLIMPAALQRVMNFHLGTAIAGSVLLPSINMVKLLLATVPRKRNVYFCRRAAFWKTAFVYVQVALHGTSLMESLCRSSQLIQRNHERLRQGHLLLDSLILLARGLLAVLAAAGSAAASYFLVGYNSVWTPCGADKIRPTISPAGVAIIAAVMSWSLSLPIFAMYQEAVYALLHSFCEDLERNDGSSLRPYWMPLPLQTAMQQWDEYLRHQDRKPQQAAIRHLKCWRPVRLKLWQTWVLKSRLKANQTKNPGRSEDAAI
eukprot:jgi/Botrbrau1/17503/Bobra.0054s0079.1